MARNTYPRKIEDWYARQLKKQVRKWNEQASFYLRSYIYPTIKGGKNFLYDDENEPDLQKIIEAEKNSNDLNRLLDLMVKSLNSAQNNYNFDSLATQFVHAVNQFSYKGVKAQITIRGVDPISDNPALRAYVKTKISENVALIEKMKTSYLYALREDIYNSITKGGGVGAITQALMKRTNMTKSHALLIANDQTGTIVSQLNFYRAKHTGATKYVWHSMEDRRVRPKHRELDGQTFEIDDPDGGDNGQKPGEPIRCRCYAEFF